MIKDDQTRQIHKMRIISNNSAMTPSQSIDLATWSAEPFQPWLSAAMISPEVVTRHAPYRAFHALICVDLLLAMPSAPPSPTRAPAIWCRKTCPFSPIIEAPSDLCLTWFGQLHRHAPGSQMRCQLPTSTLSRRGAQLARTTQDDPRIEVRDVTKTWNLMQLAGMTVFPKLQLSPYSMMHSPGA